MLPKILVAKLLYQNNVRWLNSLGIDKLYRENGEIGPWDNALLPLSQLRKSR
jgi:hypothetical protein